MMTFLSTYGIYTPLILTVSVSTFLRFQLLVLYVGNKFTTVTVFTNKYPISDIC